MLASVRAIIRTDGGSGVTRAITHLKNKTDKLKQASEHSFAFELNNYAGESATKKPNALLVDCDATTHIINDESKFSKFHAKFAQRSTTSN